MKQFIEKSINVILVMLIVPSVSIASMVTFDTVPAGTPIPYGGTYSENGMIVTSYSDYSQIGDPLTGSPSNAFYFHGSGQYIDVRMVENYYFDLLQLDYKTNGFSDYRWIETSAGALMYLPGVYPLTTVNLPSEGFTNIEWFRVGTPYFATQVDNIYFESTGIMTPTPSSIMLLVTGLFGIAGLRSKQEK